MRATAIFASILEFDMKYRFRNPHPFDMSNYFSGLTCVVGGRDFELEEKEARLEGELPKSEDQEQFKLDWSFLKSYPKPRPH